MPQFLSSWKEIANHFGRGVRTVQRWENTLGLPVHRPDSFSRNVVFAIPEELDQWVKSFAKRNEQKSDVESLLLRIKELELENSGLREEKGGSFKTPTRSDVTTGRIVN